MPQLREFIYLDNERLNNNLSSLGKGIPAEITHASENQTEKSGEAGGNLLGIQAGGQYGDLSRKQVETRLDITAPYRFQDLLDELEDIDIDIYTNPDVRRLNRGDVVKIEAEVYPMSIFKIQIAVEAFQTLANDNLKNSLQTLNQEAPYQEQEINEMEALSTMVKEFLGSKMPLRLETDEEVYCTSLKQNGMRTPARRAFLENTNFTVFGRVNRCIPRNDRWDPIDAMNIASRFLPEGEDSVENFRDDVRNVSNKLNISMGNEDFFVKGRTAVIDPIAVYW
ncbi:MULTISPECIES: DUF6414 family protein [Haloferacaceae]|uniref:Uncharacterized protein n=1 Tax=Halorubrum glutamatedens TaxID=2707018 RepID=A0ABD5QQ86_9EURY|nr:hypothetical protein [Halobellus captivus]